MNLSKLQHKIMGLPLIMLLSIIFAISALGAAILYQILLPNLDHQTRQIEASFNQTTALLEQYPNRIISQALPEISTLSSQIEDFLARLKRMDSQKIESQLTQYAIKQGLTAQQITLNRNLVDESGEFSQLTFKLSGTVSDLSAFLTYTLSDEFVLIWQRLSIEFDRRKATHTVLELDLKHYTKIIDERQ